MASVFYPLGRKGKNKKRQPLILSWPNWQQLFVDQSSLQVIFSKGYKPQDILEQYISAFQPGGAFAEHGTLARQQALGFLKRHGAHLCQDLPVDAVRKLYEVVSEQAARVAEDGMLGASRIQMQALDALTLLLVGLRVHETDPRLLKVHVQRLYRDLDPRAQPGAASAAAAVASRGSGSGGGGAKAGGGASVSFSLQPELHHQVAASDCLRSIEVAFPGMLLSGAGRLLELSLAEANTATPAATQLAVTVLSHGAARYVEQQKAAAAAATAAAAAAAAAGQATRPGARGLAHCMPSRSSDRLASGSLAADRSSIDGSGCTSPLAHSLVATTDGYSSDGPSDGMPRPASPTHPKAVPLYGGASLPDLSSPSGVASLTLFAASATTTSASNASSGGTAAAKPPQRRAAAAAPPLPAVAEPAPAGAAGASGAAEGAAAAGSEAASSAGGLEVPLLPSKAGAGLRHFYVPEYYKAQGAQGLEGCRMVLPADAKQKLQEAVPHFLRLLPRVVPEDLQQMAAMLAPLLQAADCPPATLQPLMERHLRSHNLPLLQAVLMLLDGLPSVYQPWQDALIDQLFRILVGRSAPEQRAAVLSWLLRLHHQQRHNGEPSLFENNWSAALPAVHDDVLLLTLKVKALTSCIAAGIGDAWQMVEALAAWEGFWVVAPTAQELRAAAYMLRMLCCAECHPQLGTNEHRLKAMVVSLVVQVVATRPQFLPSVESFMQHCPPAVRGAILMAVNQLLSVAAPPAATAARKRRRQQAGGRQSGLGLAAALAPPAGSTHSSSLGDVSSSGGSGSGGHDGSVGNGGGGGGSPSEHSAQQHSSTAAAVSHNSGGSSTAGSEGSGSGTGWDDSVATQGANSEAKGSSRAPSAFASPEHESHPHHRHHPHTTHSHRQGASSRRSSGAYSQGGAAGEESEPEPVTPTTAGSLSPAHRHRRRHHHSHNHHHHHAQQQQQQQKVGPGSQLQTARSAPAPLGSSALAASVAAEGGLEPGDSSNTGGDAFAPSLPPPISIVPRQQSTPLPMPSRQPLWQGLGTPTAALAAAGRQEEAQPLSARLSSSLPSFFGRFWSSAAAAAQQQQHGPPSPQQRPQAGRTPRSPGQGRWEAQQAQQAEQQRDEGGGDAPAAGEQEGQDAEEMPMDRATRAALIRSASFSAIAAAAGWIKAQHWVMDPNNLVLGSGPQPPDSIANWQGVEAWLSAAPTWEGLANIVLRHDAMLYRTLLLEIVQSRALCPLGALSFLEQYARRYIGELPGDALPATQVGTAMLAICQAAVMTHLFGHTAQGGWSDEQADVAQSVQSVLAELSTAFPVAQTRHKAGAFLQHLSAATSALRGGDPPSGDPGVGFQLMQQLLGGYLAEAIAGGSSSSSPV